MFGGSMSAHRLWKSLDVRDHSSLPNRRYDDRPPVVGGEEEGDDDDQDDNVSVISSKSSRPTGGDAKQRDQVRNRGCLHFRPTVVC